MSLNRILVLATNAFREVVRDRILYILGFYALLLIIAVRLLPQVASTAQNKIFLDFGLAAMSVVGLLVAVFVGTGLVSKEIEKRTVLVLIAKPISRSEFITGKHLGLSAVLAVLIAAMTAIYLLVLEFGQIAYPIGSILLTAVYLFFEMCLITAVAIGLSIFTSPALATLLTVGVYLMGEFSQHLLELGHLSKNPNFERLTQVFYLVLPDLSRLDLKNQAVYGPDLLPSSIVLLSNAGYGLLYTILVLAIAILVFSYREF